MPDYRVSPLVQELPATVPFVGPETQERNQGYLFKARIGANESVFGPSPNAIQAMADAASESWMYGDPEFHDLREDLAAHHQVESGNIMVGEGIDGMLGYVARMFLQPGDTVVTSAGAYPTFNYHVNGYGGKLEFVPYRDDREDLDALIQKATQLQARLIYVSNPDNPMGSWWDAQSIESITKQIPENCLLILDEAYGEFAPPGTLPPLDLDNQRLLRMRTFSKAYGLAGLRVGYGIASKEIAEVLNRVRHPFNVNSLALAAAEAALGDESFLADSVRRNLQGLKQLGSGLDALGLDWIPSVANFICARVGINAEQIYDAMLKLGVIVRPVANYGLPEHLRISVGLESENVRALAVLSEARTSSEP